MTKFVNAQVIHSATFQHQMKKYSYIGARVSVHRSRSLLQLCDTIVKTSDGVMLAVISYCRLLHDG